MKAVVKYGYGPQETALRDIPIPEIGESDILMEVKAAGVCGSDIAFDDGHHENLLNPPVVLGHEFAGVVSKVGKNVTDWKVGDRIVSDNTGYVCGKCYACSVSNYLVCPDRLGLGYGMDGGFAKYVKIPGQVLAVFPNSLLKIPDSMSFEEAAILDPCCNAYKAVVQDSSFMPGDYAAVFGVGALGQFSIQVLKAAGAAKIVAVGLTGDESRLALAKQNGATDIIYNDKEDLDKRIDEITNGEKLGLVVDCAGANIVLKQAINIIRNGSGEIVKIGYDEKPLGYSLDPLLDSATRIQGHYGYDWVSWRNAMNLIVAKKLNPNAMISHKMKISEFRKAFELVKNKEAIKIILYPED